jgi:hypothetical protein
MSTSYKQSEKELTRCNLGKVFKVAAGDKRLLKLYRKLANLNGLHHELNEYLCLLGYQITGGNPAKRAGIREQGSVLYEKIMELESRILDLKLQIQESKRQVVAKPAAEVVVKPAVEVVAKVSAKPAAVVTKPTKRKAAQPKGHIEAGFEDWNSEQVKRLCQDSKRKYPHPSKEMRK